VNLECAGACGEDFLAIVDAASALASELYAGGVDSDGPVALSVVLAADGEVTADAPEPPEGFDVAAFLVPATDASGFEVSDPVTTSWLRDQRRTILAGSNPVPFVGMTQAGVAYKAYFRDLPPSADAATGEVHLPPE
jgi:hypothetical protein